MPYLDSKIQKHRKNCFNPVGKRLYIRDYDDSGKQKFVSWGLTCTTCGVVVKDKYERNLTKKERRISDRGYLESHRKWKIRHKLERLQRRSLGNIPITPEESGLRRRINNLKNFYEYSGPHWGKDLNDSWSQNVVEKFLNLSPRPTIAELKQVFYLPKSVISVDSQRHFKDRGYVPNPEKEGWLKYDKEA